MHRCVVSCEEALGPTVATLKPHSRLRNLTGGSDSRRPSSPRFETGQHVARGSADQVRRYLPLVAFPCETPSTFAALTQVSRASILTRQGSKFEAQHLLGDTMDWTVSRQQCRQDQFGRRRLRGAQPQIGNAATSFSAAWLVSHARNGLVRS
jgi:hypothetical protein